MIYVRHSQDPRVADEKERNELRNDFRDLRDELRGVRDPAAKSTNAANYANYAFERAKASASYGIVETIQYRLILPLKELFVELTHDQKADLDFYQKHTALCSGIQKVQNAYKSYIAAQKAADETPTEPGLARKEARLHAIAKGNSLVAGYTDLIKLAIDQADEIDVAKAEYVNDLNRELDKDFLINHTVNTIRTKAIETDWLDFEHEDFLKDNYVKFVTEFVTNVREARLQLGDSSVSDDDDIIYISNAYIQGLANIPELGELDNGLVLISYYDELTRLQAPESVAKAQNEVIEYFKEQIETLMKRSWSIRTEDLQNIQYKGISLLSVVKTLDAEKLNELKGLGRNLQSKQMWIQQTQTDINTLKQSISESVEYNFNDVHDFLRTIEKEVLAGIQKDESALGRVVKSYTEALKIHDDLTKQIKETTESQEKEKEARTNQIGDNRTKLAALNKQIAGLKQDIVTAYSEIETKQRELENFQAKIAARLEKLNGEKEDVQLTKMLIDGLKKESAEKMRFLQDEIVKLGDSLQVMQRVYEAQQALVNTLADEQYELIETDSAENEQGAKALQALRKKLEELATKPIAELTGEAIKTLAASSLFKTESRIFDRLIGIHDAESKIVKVEKPLSDLQSSAEDTQTKMANILPHMTLKGEQAFELDAAMFGDEEKAEIAAQLESNLVIAKKVTMAVGREVVKQDVEFLDQKAEKDTESSHRSKRVYANVESKLKTALDAREEEVRKVDLTLLVSEGLEKRLTVKKPVEVMLPQGALNVSDPLVLSDEDEI